MDSLEEADRKIDTLAATGQLDPALMLMMAKAYQVLHLGLRCRLGLIGALDVLLMNITTTQ